MKTVRSWDDLRPFGIIALTGEACGLMYRILFDLTASGKRILDKCLSCDVQPAEPWNRGDDADPHIGSVMLTHEMLQPLGVFALLENGCSEVWKGNELLIGIEPTDSQDQLEATQRIHGLLRRFAYKGTAGDRNIHMMTGRVV